MQEIYLYLSQMSKIRTYLELRRLDTFEERYHYLRLGGSLGLRTFGFDRWVNQRFYKSREWKYVRDQVIIRDNGCDLGILGYEIITDLMIHHMNPISLDDIKHGDESIIDPNFLITTSLRTHNAIHYGDESLLPRGPIERKSGDTTLW
jgi:acetyltransferase-like isoleucine patch superfamily enzyme